MKLIKLGVKWCKDNPHCLAMLYLIFYLLMFFTLDHVMKPRFIIHCPLDDYIPFNEYFFIFYSLWYIAFPGMLVYYMITDKHEFQSLWFNMFTGYNICFIIYMILPNGLDLRVDIPDRNIFAAALNVLWKADAAVNVCPSMHVSSCSAIFIVTARSKQFKKYPLLKWLICITMVLICISTMFVKQHSIIDVVCGLALSLVLMLIDDHFDWRSRTAKTFLKPII